MSDTRARFEAWDKGNTPCATIALQEAARQSYCFEDLETCTRAERDRAWVAATDAAIERVSGLLVAAVCPMAAQGCDGKGYPVPDNYGGWEQEQCQWCHDRAALRALKVRP